MATVPQDFGGYFDLGPVDLAEDIRRLIVKSLIEMGFTIEASHHEVGKGQHEINSSMTMPSRTPIKWSHSSTSQRPYP